MIYLINFIINNLLYIFNYLINLNWGLDTNKEIQLLAMNSIELKFIY